MSHLNKLLIALEADDVTEEARNGAEDTTGDSNKADYSNTDDIFGVESPDGNGGSAEGDPNSDDMDMDDEGDDDMGDDDLGGDDEASEEGVSDAQKKMVLRDNFIELYSIVKGNITQLNEYKFNLSIDNDTNTADIVKNLTDLKRSISNILTNDFKGLEYSTALMKYLSAKEVYDISIMMLYEHFDNIYNKDKKNDSKKQRESNN